MTDEPDTYDPLDNAFKSYSVAIRALRLQGIREGKLEPRLDDEEEVAVAVEAGFKIETLLEGQETMAETPKPFAIINGEPWWKFSFTYRFEGKEYAFDIPARSASEAQARLGQMSLGRYEGQIDGDEVPLWRGGFLIPLKAWWRNLCAGVSA